MILDSGKTQEEVCLGHRKFESVVILDSGKTFLSVPTAGERFESVVILDSGKTSPVTKS